MYEKLILEIDAIDNGVTQAPDMKYHIGTGLGSRVGRMNPGWGSDAWNDPNAQHV